MLLLFLIIVIVTIIIGVILLQTKSTTTLDKTNPSPAAQSQRTNVEKKYVESINILSNLSENRKVQPKKPKLSITLNNFIVNKHLNLLAPGLMEHISKLSVAFDVYILLLVSILTPKDDAVKGKIVLEKFKSIVPPHKVMLCHTEDGLIAMIRQLKPRFHFENNGFVVEKLSQHLDHILALKDLKAEIDENSKKSAKWANILNHNVDFYDNFEVIPIPNPSLPIEEYLVLIECRLLGGIDNY